MVETHLGVRPTSDPNLKAYRLSSLGGSPTASGSWSLIHKVAVTTLFLLWKLKRDLSRAGHTAPRTKLEKMYFFNCDNYPLEGTGLIGRVGCTALEMMQWQ